MVLRIPLQLELVEAYLAKRDLPRARLEADRMLEAVLVTADAPGKPWPGTQAHAWRSTKETSLMLTAKSKNALDTTRGFDVPLASWRVHKTAALVSSINGNTGMRDFHSVHAREVVFSLFKSLDSHSALQQTFRSSPAISEILGNDHEVATSSN
jgi:hypothetical protein